MSSQTSGMTGPEPWEPSCTFCDCGLTEKLLALQIYTSEAASLPANVPHDGGLTLCSECAIEVRELLSNWQPHGQPPVSKDSPIGNGYKVVASACSFCSDRCEGPVLGVELYRRVGDELPAYANYTLCEHCQSVFNDFLQNVRSEIQR